MVEGDYSGVPHTENWVTADLLCYRYSLNKGSIYADRFYWKKRKEQIFRTVESRRVEVNEGFLKRMEELYYEIVTANRVIVEKLSDYGMPGLRIATALSEMTGVPYYTWNVWVSSRIYNTGKRSFMDYRIPKLHLLFHIYGAKLLKMKEEENEGS